MWIKISFTHYVKWTRVMLPVVIEEFELVCLFVCLFSVTLSVNKMSTLPKISGEALVPPLSPVSTGLMYVLLLFV